jgi:putative hydrolase of the HAD superfamily
MKILLLDADGVALKKKGYFSEHFANEYNVPVEDILPFIKNEYRLCQRGKADLKEELINYLPKWKWEGSTDSFLEYWFKTDTEADPEVFELVEQFKAKGIRCHLATDQEQYRAAYIHEELGFNTKLDGCFFSYELGSSKSESAFFEKVIETQGVEPDDITYFDDDEENVAVAKSKGIDARYYTSIDDLKGVL